MSGRVRGWAMIVVAALIYFGGLGAVAESGGKPWWLVIVGTGFIIGSLAALGIVVWLLVTGIGLLTEKSPESPVSGPQRE